MRRLFKTSASKIITFREWIESRTTDVKSYYLTRIKIKEKQELIALKERKKFSKNFRIHLYTLNKRYAQVMDAELTKKKDKYKHLELLQWFSENKTSDFEQTVSYLKKW